MADQSISLNTGATVEGRLLARVACGYNSIQYHYTAGNHWVFDDPASMMVKNAAAVTLDGKLDEPEWANAPSLIFGNGAQLKRQVSDRTVTGGVDVKATFKTDSVTNISYSE